MEKISRRLFYIYRNWYYLLVELMWMNGICLIWSRGRLISPSLPVGDDRYLNLSSQKRPTGRNLGGNRSDDALAPRPEVLLSWCFICTCAGSHHIRANEMNCVGSSEYITRFTSFTRASFLNMRADQSSSWLTRIDHFVTVCLTIAFAKCPKIGNTSPLFKICFLKIYGFI